MGTFPDAKLTHPIKHVPSVGKHSSLHSSCALCPCRPELCLGHSCVPSNSGRPGPQLIQNTFVLRSFPSQGCLWPDAQKVQTWPQAPPMNLVSSAQKSPSQLTLGVRKAAKTTFSLTQTCELSLSGLFTLRVILFRTTEKYMSLRELDGRDRSRHCEPGQGHLCGYQTGTLRSPLGRGRTSTPVG